jgi:signal transduction histidine kinase
LDVVPTILDVICRTTGLRFSAVARVTSDRWIACAVKDELGFGLRPGGELQIETTFCNEIRQSGTLIAIDHVAQDDTFRNHPTPKMYGFQSYISVPIRLSDGRFFGTLCALDPKPSRVKTLETIGMFELFANLIGLHLDAHDRLQASQVALFDERHHTKLQNQFIAVLGHDLRNPLSAIPTGAELLRSLPLDEKAGKVAAVIDSSARRMAGIISNVLDFARGRLGSGLPVALETDFRLGAVLEQVIDEMRTARPGRTIHSEITVTRPVTCDSARIGQLLSNLLGNALAHGDPNGPVWVRASDSGGSFELAVTNRGDAIPQETINRLFEPFERGSDRRDREGLGLGLYIAAEIARAHNGSLEVRSSPDETCFTFRIPGA